MDRRLSSLDSDTKVGSSWLIRSWFRCLQWYLRPWAVALLGGLLPFGSIFIEVSTCASCLPRCALILCYLLWKMPHGMHGMERIQARC